MFDLIRKSKALTCAALVAVGLAVGGGLALAQTIAIPYVTSLTASDIWQVIKGGVPSAQNTYATGAQMRSFILGGASNHTTAPALTSCVTGSGTIVGTDNAFILTGGSTASTSCVATFGTAFVSTPVCTVSSQTAYATSTPSFTVSTTAVTITQASSSSLVYDVICIARPGG